MALVKYDPFRGFESISRKMQNMMDSFDSGFGVQLGSFAPRVDISEDEKNVYIHAEIPGMSKEDVKVTLNDENVLVIKGKKEREVKEGGDGKSFLRMERSYGEFSRSFVLPDNVKRDSITGKFDNGVLELTIEKSEPVKPKEVEVNIQ